MTIIQLPMFDDNSQHDPRPLPLIVADKWGFPLAYVDVDGETKNYLYAAKDWAMGLGGDRTTWAKVQKQLLLPTQQLPYQASNGKTYNIDFVTAPSLYAIAQEMRGMKKRPQLQEIRDYLKESGALVDEYRLNPESAVDDAMGQYAVQGKTDSWTEARIQGVITRKQFTDALKAAVLDAPANLYAVGTEKVYAGLWQRTTAQLRGELGLERGQNVRDHFGEYALTYTRLAEMLAVTQLGNAETVPMSIAMEIVYRAADMIRGQAQETAAFLGIDLITGHKLLSEG